MAGISREKYFRSMVSMQLYLGPLGTSDSILSRALSSVSEGSCAKAAMAMNPMARFMGSP